MKLRINGNSIRLRLSQTEVAQCGEVGNISDQLELPGSQIFNYEIRSTRKADFSVQFGQNLVIEVPEAILSGWALTDSVGIYKDLLLDDQSTLRLIIERDYKCLDDRVGEDESDLYPNPKATNG